MDQDLNLTPSLPHTVLGMVLICALRTPHTLYNMGYVDCQNSGKQNGK